MLPDEPVFAQVGLASAVPQTLYTLALDAPLPPLEISEIVAANATGLTNEHGLVTDWFEIRNCSTNPVPLDGVSLAPLFFETSQRYAFPDGSVLQPGEHRVIFSDNLPTLGAAHAPFGLSRTGDQLTLTGTTPHGARTLIDSVAFGPQNTNAAFARIGCGGPWRTQAPTPRGQNVPGNWLGFVSTKPGRFTLAFPTERDKSYLVEYTDSLFPPQWTALPPVPGDGIEKTITQLIKKQRYYRVSSE